MPDGLLCKGAAARSLADRLGVPLLAAGDSLLDAALLTAADVAIRPAHGELHHTRFDGAAVTSASGADAAQEILAFLGAQADLLAGAVPA